MLVRLHVISEILGKTGLSSFCCMQEVYEEYLDEDVRFKRFWEQGKRQGISKTKLKEKLEKKKARVLVVKQSSYEGASWERRRLWTSLLWICRTTGRLLPAWLFSQLIH